MKRRVLWSSHRAVTEQCITKYAFPIRELLRESSMPVLLTTRCTSILRPQPHEPYAPPLTLRRHSRKLSVCSPLLL